MNIIMCIDDGGGIMFNRRRQSQDRALRGRVVEMSRGARLRMSPYTARQFRRDFVENMAVSEGFLQEAQDGDYCFVEDQDPRPYEDAAEHLIIYRWNRNYPRDTQLPLDLAKWHLVQSTDFEGSSHENITEEVYVREPVPEETEASPNTAEQETIPEDGTAGRVERAADDEQPLEQEEAASRCIE